MQSKSGQVGYEKSSMRSGVTNCTNPGACIQLLFENVPKGVSDIFGNWNTAPARCQHLFAVRNRCLKGFGEIFNKI